METKESNVLIIGASAAGLACAARLGKKGIDYIVIEKEEKVANSWRNHYERLHLHTDKGHSTLPFMEYPKEVDKYPPRVEVIRYLERYCEELGINPQFNTSAMKVYREGNEWITETNQETFKSKYLIFASGKANKPRPFTKSGLDSFPGKIMHSSEYKNGKEFKGKNILVVGFGNSACEIAICLHEHGAHPALSVRSPVNVVPRDIFGIPVLSIGILMSRLPVEVSDKINRPLIKWLVGDVEKVGLKKAPYGPITQIVRHHKIPLLDIGTMDLLRSGDIKAYGDIIKVDGKVIHFEDDKQQEFDAIVAATGYEHGLERIIDLEPEVLEDMIVKYPERKYLGKDNLFFCGFHVSRTGMLREISLESDVIAEMIGSTN